MSKSNPDNTVKPCPSNKTRLTGRPVSSVPIVKIPESTHQGVIDKRGKETEQVAAMWPSISVADDRRRRQYL